MLTEFGKTVRKYRIDKQMKLGEMAAGVGVSAAYLSSVETGKKNLSDELVIKIINLLRLDEAAQNELTRAAYESRSEHRINVANANDDFTRETVAMFARSIDSSTLSKEKADRIRDILKF